MAVKIKRGLIKIAVSVALGTVVVSIIGGWAIIVVREYEALKNREIDLAVDLKAVKSQLARTKSELEELQNSDQVVRNNELERKIGLIQTTYNSSVGLYEKLLDLRSRSNKVLKLETAWAGIVATLAKSDYESANSQLEQLKKELTKLETELAVVAIPANLLVSNNPPAAGAARQVVKIDTGSFVVDIISANLATTKVVVDTASTGNCSNDCPVLPLAEYAKRSGAFAAINGPYFCPATYPSCDGKKNTFDTLLMNKDKTYFNSDNNVYSTNPVAVFSTTSRFVEKGMEWGRDTGVDAVIMGRPLLVFNNEVKFGGNDDTKESARGSRAFIGATDSTVYIGIVRAATVAEAARVVAGMGIRNAINLDSGGSTAMWSGGRYLAGPGRDLPFGILLVRR